MGHFTLMANCIDDEPNQMDLHSVMLTEEENFSCRLGPVDAKLEKSTTVHG